MSIIEIVKNYQIKHEIKKFIETCQLYNPNLIFYEIEFKSNKKVKFKEKLIQNINELSRLMNTWNDYYGAHIYHGSMWPSLPVATQILNELNNSINKTKETITKFIEIIELSLKKIPKEDSRKNNLFRQVISRLKSKSKNLNDLLDELTKDKLNSQNTSTKFNIRNEKNKIKEALSDIFDLEPFKKLTFAEELVKYNVFQDLTGRLIQLHWYLNPNEMSKEKNVKELKVSLQRKFVSSNINDFMIKKKQIDTLQLYSSGLWIFKTSKNNKEDRIAFKFNPNINLINLGGLKNINIIKIEIFHYISTKEHNDSLKFDTAGSKNSTHSIYAHLQLAQYWTITDTTIKYSYPTPPVISDLTKYKLIA